VSAPAPAAPAPAVATRVLVVDDQPPFRSAARTLVGLLRGWSVVGEAESGEDAVRLAAELAPDVVLMDINLPGRNGIEATRELLATAPATVVVLTSTYAADDLPAGAATCGAVGYLRKEELTPRVLRELVASAGAAAGAPAAGSGTTPRTDVP
jgi:two-component system, NarL family, invasion response regulator UvrY